MMISNRVAGGVMALMRVVGVLMRMPGGVDAGADGCGLAGVEVEALPAM